FQILRDLQSVMRFFFFFSSRRRHTRSKRDWSSDVCSSDLLFELGGVQAQLEEGAVLHVQLVLGSLIARVRHELDLRVSDLGEQRSEERRVGKECGGMLVPFD